VMIGEIKRNTAIVNFRTNFAPVIFKFYDHISAGRKSFKVLG
jgi:hypothetical protein